MNVINPASHMPPEDLRARVSGSRDPAWFDQSGSLTVGEWQRILASQGMDFADFATIIDFGCGCGRALRHLRQHVSAEQRLIGVDPDHEAIAWLADNLPGVTVHPLADLPPASMIEPESADLVLSHSVFTHLPEDVQFAWLNDLARILKPGGLLVASIHGSKVVTDYANSLEAMDLKDESAHVRAEMKSKGFFHVVGKNEFEAALPMYYGAAFHDISYIYERWTSDFEIKAWFPIFALKHQDVLVLKRK
jgi:SAM-dependent methyltransferase